MFSSVRPFPFRFVQSWLGAGLSLFAVTHSVAAFAKETPSTLFELAGAHPVAARLSQAVLVIIDAQRTYEKGPLALPGADSAVREIAVLLARARAFHVPIIHVLHEGTPGSGIFDPRDGSARPIAALTPAAGEPIVVKHLPNAFAGTTLEKALERIGRKDLIVVGFMTHMCVSSTVRAALDRGYRCTIVSGGCATRDLSDGHGGVVAAAVVQRVELAALADRFAVVVDGPADIGD